MFACKWKRKNAIREGCLVASKEEVESLSLLVESTLPSYVSSFYSSIQNVWTPSHYELTFDKKYKLI